MMLGRSRLILLRLPEFHAFCIKILTDLKNVFTFWTLYYCNKSEENYLLLIAIPSLENMLDNTSD